MKFPIVHLRRLAAAASSLVVALLVLGACAPQGAAPSQVASAPTGAPSSPTATALAPTAAVPAAGATGAAGTPAPRATLVQPSELPSKGSKDAPVTIIEFSDFQ
ncbi:MAG: hypothetical protein U0822_00950 [Anaerolineae bacterium]